MNSYGFLAGCYDEFTTDVDYAAWAEYIQRHFERAGLPGSTVLDLACGTGSLTRELSLRGYEMIGVDLSPDMLAQARRIPFGEQAVVGYLYAREAEFTAIRTILSGRMAGLDADTIRERLREAYV